MTEEEDCLNNTAGIALFAALCLERSNRECCTKDKSKIDFGLEHNFLTHQQYSRSKHILSKIK